MSNLTRLVTIFQVDLDIKPLIIEAHQIGQQELMYVVPFVAKVLESCAKSKVFKPPSPWTMGIMNLLSELHQEHDLKLNLKFEIEVLCKALNIELATLTPGNLLNQVVQIRSFGLKSQTPPAANQVIISLRPFFLEILPRYVRRPTTKVHLISPVAPITNLNEL